MFAASKTDSASTGGYQISRSLRFNDADTAYLTRTPASASNRKTWTWSAWIKRGKIDRYERYTLFASRPTANPYTLFYFSGGAQPNQYGLRFEDPSADLQTTQVFRDVSAWYHIVLAVDTTQATASNRIKMYVNGSQITVFTAASYPAQNTDMSINNTTEQCIGSNTYSASTEDFDGYMTEVNLIDGSQLTPSSFGQTDAQTGVWQPKAYSGSYGTNGFYLNFSDNSNTTAATLGKDYSGNGNNWTPNNFSVTAGAGNDSLVDSPTSYGTDTGVGGTVRGNYCTLNPLYKNGAGTPAYTNGNLDMLAGGTGDSYFGGTFSISSGKWYYECLVNSVASSGGTGLLIGICKTSAPNGVNVGAYRNTSEIYNLDGTTQTAGATYATGDLIGVAFDIDAGTVQFYKNGTAQGATPSFTFTAGTEVFVRGRSDGANPSVTFNFGQRAFAYTAPSGYKALCTQNLPTPTIGATTATQAGKYFNTVLYTGNSSTLAVTGVGFQPDLVWGKDRSTALNHRLFDAVRGVTNRLSSNLTSAEATESGVTAFNSDGFTLGSDQGLNFASDTYVAWNWKANGSGSTNTAGSITSTVSANTTSGFSVVTWTGNGADASIGHGLGVAPSMVIHKFRSAVSNWSVYTSTTGAGKRLKLNSTDAVATDGSFPTTPTSTVFYINGGSNDNGVTMVAYCFAPIAGYSAFGSYTGNGNTNRNFVYLGFTPALILVKRTSSAGTNWRIVNPRRVYLSPNTSDAEYASYPGPFLQTANGFEISGGDDVNENGGTFIYAAFASVPFKFSLAQ